MKKIFLISFFVLLTGCSIFTPYPQRSVSDNAQAFPSEQPEAETIGAGEEQGFSATTQTQLEELQNNVNTPTPPLQEATPLQPAVPLKPAVQSKPESSTLMSTNGQTSLTLNLPYQQAWSQTGKALSLAGYPVMEQDTTLGTYYILDKIGTGGVIKRDTPIYQLHLKKEGDKTIVTLSNAQNKPADSNTSQRILGILK